MSALFSLLFGVAAYGTCLVTLSYLVGFAGNMLVPKSVDSGASASWLQAACVDLLLLGLFAAQHSVMARRAFKRWWTRVVPMAVERSTYVLAACVALALLFWQWVPIPAPVIWQIDNAAAESLIRGGFWLGWLVLLVSSFQINHFELFGLRQVFTPLTGRELPEQQFKTPLLYRYVRHPLYAGLLLGLWCVPVMTAGHLLFSLGATVYVLVGIWFEERDLITQFGERYRRYRADVGMLLPRRTRS